MRDNLYNDDERLYLQMIQDNITRLSANSANCKTWLVMIIAAIFAIGCNINEMNWWLLLSLAPIALFWYLDSFYLRLERGMRNRQRLFLNLCDRKDLSSLYNQALFDLRPYFIDKIDEDLTKEEKEQHLVRTKGCYKTGSILPFYTTLIIIVLIITLLINASDIINWIMS